jgi:16S rRNA (uracil1498-N3)-methyltransferase
MPTRIFLSRPATGESVVPLDPSTVHYLTRVLRMKEGDRLQGFDSMGAAYDLVLGTMPGGEIVARVLARHPAALPASVTVTLAQSLPKGPKLDTVLRQGTEMGVTAFLPFLSERAISRPDEDGALHKKDRWEKIVVEACRQCGRLDVPRVYSLGGWTDVLEGMKVHELNLFLHEKEAPPLKSVLESAPGVKSVMLIVGPEGGWSPSEARDVMEAGAHPVHLPTPVLRTETAGLAAAAMVRFFYGVR